MDIDGVIKKNFHVVVGMNASIIQILTSINEKLYLDVISCGSILTI